MARFVVKTSPIDFPQELVRFLDDPPLVGDETKEDYRNFFAAVASGVKPVGNIDWIYTQDVVDLSLQIRRERLVLAGVIKLLQKEVVLHLLKTTFDTPNAEHAAPRAAVYRIFNAENDAQRWASDPKAREEIDALLAARGHSSSSVLASAHIRGASQIDAIDRRIASCEMRRMVILREIERRSEKFARELGEASSNVIDGEFSEAAE